MVDFGDTYSLMLVVYGIMESALALLAIVGIFALRIWPIPIAWVMNKVTRKQYGVIEVQTKGKKIAAYLADFTKDYFQKNNRLYNLLAAKDQDLVFNKYGVPVIHFEEDDVEPKAFHPKKETPDEKARHSMSVSNLLANTGTWYKRMAFSLQERKDKLLILAIAGVGFLVIVVALMTLSTMNAQGATDAKVNLILEIVNASK